MKQLPLRHRQRGIALWLLLVLVLLTGSYAYYRTSNLQPSRYYREGELNLAMAKAKEALIAYAVIDANRPGRLPCPDLVGDGVSPLLTRNDCDSYVGSLPWRTLDLQESGDGFGDSFRYVLSPLFGGDRATPPLNSDTPTSLRLDVTAGQPSNDIVALIIAPRGAVDTRNADGDDYFYRGSGQTPDDNDIIVPVTRRELMAAVERRIAREVNNCLEQHATSPQNTGQIYPWPAPLGKAGYPGTPESLFGRVPSTQPGNPDEVLKRTIADLKASKISLESASTAGEQLTALQTLQSQAAYARAFFDSLYIAALNLNTRAENTRRGFATLDTQIDAATKNLNAFNNGFAEVIAQIANQLITLETLQQALSDSGLDLFVMEGKLLNATLQERQQAVRNAPTNTTTLSNLLGTINDFRTDFLPSSSTPNPEISAALNTSKSLAATARQDTLTAADALKINDPLASSKVMQAINSSEALRIQNNALLAAALASRYNIAAGEFAFRSQRVALALASLGDLTLEQARDQLLPILEESRSLTTGLATGAPGLLSQRSAVLNSLDTAIASARSASDLASMTNTARAAVAQLTALSNALLVNGENVASESLAAAGKELQATTSTPPTTVSGGAGLSNPTQTIVYWATVAQDQSATVARQARRGVTALNDSETSAYTAARQFLAKLDGDTGAIKALESHIAAPSDATKAATASRRLAEADTLLANLINRAEILESNLESGLALGVVPTVWYGNACTLLAPPTGSSSWWTANAWNTLIFYQISDRIRPVSGRLTVNGQGAHRTVTLASGSALDPGSGLQNRSLRETRSYLEGRNTHASRDGLAKAPVTEFQNTLPSATFNDRLAY